MFLLVKTSYEYFIGYADEYKIKPFTITLPKNGRIYKRF